MIFSRFHSVPHLQHYWSQQPSLGVPFIKSCMSCNWFELIKWYLQPADNSTFHTNNKDQLWKLHPLFNLAQWNFMCYGTLDWDLSMDDPLLWEAWTENVYPR